MLMGVGILFALQRKRTLERRPPTRQNPTILPRITHLFVLWPSCWLPLEGLTVQPHCWCQPWWWQKARRHGSHPDSNQSARSPHHHCLCQPEDPGDWKELHPFLLEMQATLCEMEHLQGQPFTLYIVHWPLEKLGQVHAMTLNQVQEAMQKFFYKNRLQKRVRDASRLPLLQHSWCHCLAAQPDATGARTWPSGPAPKAFLFVLGTTDWTPMFTCTISMAKKPLWKTIWCGAGPKISQNPAG